MKPTLTQLTALALGLVVSATAAHAGPREQAFRLHTRLAGVPPTAAVLDQMETLVADGKALDAAKLAAESSSFYNVTVKQFATPWTNEDMSVRVGLNDMTALVVGMTRDDVAFDQIMYGDILYTGKAGLTGVPAFSAANNDHFAALETQNLDLKASLEKHTQTELVPAVTDVAGAMTTRAFGEAFLEGGTNRAAVRFSFLNFLCNDMEQMSDTTIPDFRVRRDVDRQPGGDSKVFRNKCAGCHAGMDGLAGAFAHFDFVGGAVTYDTTKIADKFAINTTVFPDGFVTQDDGWVNMWTEGQNARIGWGGEKTGTGANAYGKMIAATDAFPLCMARRVYSSVCLTDIKALDPRSVEDLADDFKADGFKLKNLFAAAATRCMGD